MTVRDFWKKPRENSDSIKLMMWRMKELRKTMLEAQAKEERNNAKHEWKRMYKHAKEKRGFDWLNLLQEAGLNKSPRESPWKTLSDLDARNELIRLHAKIDQMKRNGVLSRTERERNYKQLTAMRDEAEVRNLDWERIRVHATIRSCNNGQKSVERLVSEAIKQLEKERNKRKGAETTRAFNEQLTRLHGFARENKISLN